MKPTKNDDQLNFIENTLRELYGYDNPGLLREMADAQRAWNQERLQNPQEAEEAEREADLGLDILMDKIHAAGLKPVLEKNESQKRAGYGGVASLRRSRKLVVLASVVCILALGTSGAVSARGNMRYKIYPVPGQQNKRIKYNGVLVENTGKLEEAFRKIEKELDIKVLRLGYIPRGMEFKRVIISEWHAIIEFNFKGNSVYYKVTKLSQSNMAAEALISDRMVCQTVHNTWIDKSISIEENRLEAGLCEYSANIDGDNLYYYLSGKMEKETFIKMVKNISH